MISRSLVALVAVVLVASCGQSAPSSPSPAASPGELSPYGKLFAQVGPNGEVTKEMALEAFSLAIAPLPGVTVPTGADPTEAERADGTFAIDWIRPYVDQLTPDQQAVVNKVLSPNTSAPLITPGVAVAMLGQPNLARIALDPVQDKYTQLADDARKTIGSYLGRSLDLGWSVSINTTNIQPNGKDALAYASPSQSGYNYVTGTFHSCDIYVNPNQISLNDPQADKATMAHEIFHCFQDDLISKEGKASTAFPDWIVEGQAEWAGEDVGGPTGHGAYFWGQYLTSPGIGLFGRSYDAIGFYQHMAEEGISPWGKFDPMITAWGSGTSGFQNSDAFKAAGAAADTFLDTWSSGYFRDANLGAEWNAQGPWSTGDHVVIPPQVVGAGDEKSATAGPVSDAQLEIASATDIIEADGQGHVRVHAGSAPQLPVEQRWFCTKAGGCECPPGQRYSGPDLEDIGNSDAGGYPGIEVAVTGSLDGGEVSVRGHSLDEFCKPSPSEPPPCQTNCGNSNGDPHLRTINRYRYDFQAAGEFVLLRSPDSSIVIQTRQEPYTSSRFPGVATNTAVAALDNGHKVGVYATDAGLVLHVDGQQADPQNPPDLGAGAAIKRILNGIEIDFPDGTSVSALSVGQWGINAVVNASASLVADGVGLIGPITPGNMGVPAMPDGSQLPAAPDSNTRDKIMYSTFADAWRVTDSTSLFDYDPGKSTETYTDRNFPSDGARAALNQAIASPDPNQKAAAQAACAGVTDPDLADECQYDVVATGDTGFAQSYATIQDLYDSGVITPTGPPSQAPASPGGVTGATKVVELSHLQSATIGPDNTVYASIDDASQAPMLIAIDPITGAVKTQAPMRVETALHFAAGSVWASGQASDANGHNCTVTRYDPTTLAKQGDYPIPCSAGAGSPTLTSMGDAVWAVSADGTSLTQIDPNTNQPGKSVPLPQSSGCCRDSQGAVFCFCGNPDVWRLTSTDSAFVDLGDYTSLFPAGTAFWSEQGSNAVFVDAPGAPSATVPLGDGRVVGGDPTGVYLQGASQNTDPQATAAPYDQLTRQPSDGSAPTILNSPPTSGTPGTIDETDYDYLTGNFPWFATAQGYVHLWQFKDPLDGKDALWLQWSPLP